MCPDTSSHATMEWPADLTFSKPVTHEYMLSLHRTAARYLRLANNLIATVRKDGKSTDFRPAAASDCLIWDRTLLRRGGSRHCDVITFWSVGVQFELLVIWDNTGALEKIDYFYRLALPEVKANTIYWGAIGVRGFPCPKNEEDYWSTVLWNCYRPNARATSTKASFERTHLLCRDPARRLFSNVPLPSKPLFKSQAMAARVLEHSDAAKGQIEPFKRFYEYLRGNDGLAWITAAGSPTKRNLSNLASILLDRKRKVVLVTGLPGTGKENFGRSLHFVDHLWPAASGTSGLVLLTARELQLAEKGPIAYLKEAVRGEQAGPVTVFIDELNKVEEEPEREPGRKGSPSFFAQFLRILESPENEFDLPVRFILAASEHLEDLAPRAHQDLWSRVSHQLRVAHPLSHASKEDAQDFIGGFFLWEWWKLVQGWTGERSPVKNAFIKELFGYEEGKGKDRRVQLSPTCLSVLEGMLLALVPFAERDTLSVRALRSIVGQVFTRVVVATRHYYGLPPDPIQLPKMDEDPRKQRERVIAEVVQTAVQEVLAVLNASRAAPRGVDRR